MFVYHVKQDSNLYRALFPESADWSVTNQLIAAVADVAHWFKWVRCGAEGDAPDRITRPGVANVPKHRNKGTPMRLSQAKEIYAQNGPASSSDEVKAAKLAKIFGN